MDRTASNAAPSSKRPLRVMFLHTSVAVGGAETLLCDLISRMDRARFAPALCCLKSLGPLGEPLAQSIPTFTHLIKHKYDVTVLGRLARLFRQEQIDAVVTVGAGDKMFWGRLAARAARVPAVICAIHSTGWPDRIGVLNRLLTPFTSMFVAVADAHGRYLVEQERFPAERVRIIPNGIDVERFRPRSVDLRLRNQLGLKPGPIAGVVARLDPAKNLELFLEVAKRTRAAVPAAQFLIAGDGPLRGRLEQRARDLDLQNCVHFLGYRPDVPEVLSLCDVFLLTSHVEANPVSILEALAMEKPVVSTRVGSIAETVHDGLNGFLVDPGDAAGLATRVTELFQKPELARRMGASGRAEVVRYWSVDRMVERYQELIEELVVRHEPLAAQQPALAVAHSPRGLAVDTCSESKLT